MVVGFDTNPTANDTAVHEISVEYKYDISHQVLQKRILYFTSIVLMLVCLK